MQGVQLAILLLVVRGILAADNNLWLTLGLVLAGARILTWFFVSIRAKERAGKDVLLPTVLFRSRTSNLGLITQNAQWLMLMGTSFVVSAYLQVVRGYSAVGTILTAGITAALGRSYTLAMVAVAAAGLIGLAAAALLPRGRPATLPVPPSERRAPTG